MLASSFTHRRTASVTNALGHSGLGKARAGNYRVSARNLGMRGVRARHRQDLRILAGQGVAAPISRSTGLHASMAQCLRLSPRSLLGTRDARPPAAAHRFQWPARPTPNPEDET